MRKSELARRSREQMVLARLVVEGKKVSHLKQRLRARFRDGHAAEDAPVRQAALASSIASQAQPLLERVRSGYVSSTPRVSPPFQGLEGAVNRVRRPQKQAARPGRA